MSVSSSTSTFKVGLTPEEKKLYSQLFKSLDPEGTGIITGEKARSTFEKSGLPPAILGEIWQIADQNNLGFLTQFGFCHAMRLIGYTQSGQHPTSTSGDYPGPMPKFANLNLAPAPGQLQPQSTNSSFMQSQPSALVPQNTATLQSKPQDPISTISSIDYQKFSQLFVRTVGNPNGELSGAKARDIFMKAKLSTATLGQIWSLVDKDNTGKLGMPGFVIAMHLIQGLLSGVIKQLPPFLSEHVWQSVQMPDTNAQYSGSRQASYASMSSQQTTVKHAPNAAAGSIPQPQYPQSPQRDVSGGQDANSWVVTPTMKQQYDSIFDNLDKSRNGKLSPEEVASVLMTSKLNQQDLATVWDLADIQNTGIFTKVEFSIALFLVNRKLAGGQLPNIVPDQLIDSIKSVGNSQPQTGNESKAASQPQPIQRQKTAMDDLVDVFGSGTGTAASSNTESAQYCGAETDKSTSGELPKVRKNLSGSFKPTSSFGQTLVNKPPSFTPNKEEKDEDLLGDDVRHGTQQKEAPPIPEIKNVNYDAMRSVPPPPVKNPTSSAMPTYLHHTPPPVPVHGNQSISREGSYQKQTQQPQSSQNDDLLADNNPEISGQLSQATSDTANLSNQIKSLATQTGGLHEKKGRAEQELARILKTKSDIETKLKTLRSSYDNEVQQFSQVETNLATAKEETEALRSEASISEAKFNNLSTKLNESQIGMEELQKENASLKEKLGYLNAEIVELEKQTEQRSIENQQLSNKVQVKKSQVQVAIVKNKELKDKLLELEESKKKYHKEMKDAEEQQKNAENHSRSLAEGSNTSPNNAASSGHSKGLAIGATVGTAIAGAAGIVGHKLSSSGEESNKKAASEQINNESENVSGEQQSFTSRFNVRNLVDEVQDKPSADMTGVDDLQTVDKASSSFPQADNNKQTDELNNKFPRLSMNESTEDSTNATAPSSTVMTDYKSVDGSETPVTSPSNSDFQFPEGSNAGIAGGMAAMPGFLVDVQRTDSLTSSVQNNAAMSVRDDNIDEMSDRDTIDNVTAPNTAGTAVLDSNQTKNINNTQEDSSDGDKLSSGVESFEMVNADEARENQNNQYDYPHREAANTNSETIIIKNPSRSASEQTQSYPVDNEFPPIKELDYDESSSDNESQDDNYDDAVDNLPGQSKGSYPVSKGSSNEFNSAFNDLQPATAEGQGKDLFADEFDDLEAAQVDDNLNDEFGEQNQDFGFSEDFTEEPVHSNHDTSSFASSNQQPQQQAPSTSKGTNDEWEQLFAGFGNAEPNSQSHPQSKSSQDSAVQELVGMGFDENTATKALAKQNGNLEAATNYLLDNA